MSSGLIKSFCFGLDPSEFLRQELTLTPLQRLTAKRIFIGLILIAVIMEATRLPNSRSLGVYIAILGAPLMLTSRMAYDNAKGLSKLLALGLLSGILVLIMTSDQGWFRLPVAIGVIVMMVFDARIRRMQSIAAIFFGSTVLYYTSQPLQSLDSALWDFPILIGPLLMMLLLCAHVLWPIKAHEVLHQRVMTRMDGLEALLQMLKGLSPGSLPDSALPRSHSSPGWTADVLKQLDDAVRDDKHMRPRFGGWLATIMELDNLDGGLTDYQRLWLDAKTPRPMTAHELTVIEAIARRFEGARAILKSKGTVRPDEETPPVEALQSPDVEQILRRQFLAAERLLRSTDAIWHGDPDSTGSQGLSNPTKPPSLFVRLNDPDNRLLLLWALKVGIACFFVSLIVQSLDANYVDTAILTTIIVADSTLGADYRKSIMRLSGAFLGAIMGYLWLILGQPLSDTIAGFLMTTMPFLALCAWVGATGPRLNYAGIQMGLAFSMIVFSELEPGTYLGAGWYRVLGILLGISVMGIVDYLLWPIRSIFMARLRLIQSFKFIVSVLRKNPDQTDFSEGKSVQILRMLDQNLVDAAYFLNFARMEPGSSQPENRREVAATNAIIQSLHYLSKIMESRHRLYLECRPMLKGLFLDELQTPMKRAYAQQYDAMALYLQSGKISKNLAILEEEINRIVGRMEALEAFKTLTGRERFYLDALIDLEHKHANAVADIRMQIEENLASRAIPACA
jgi:multidrug resistance protein MdtO